MAINESNKALFALRCHWNGAQHRAPREAEIVLMVNEHTTKTAIRAITAEGEFKAFLKGRWGRMTEVDIG
jgi:hypothetical protein